MIMDLVKQCSISHFGEELLLAMGNATAALDPPHTFIPWITFNGVIFYLKYNIFFVVLLSITLNINE